MGFLHMECDHAEMLAYTRNREPVVDERRHIINANLTGKDHDDYKTLKEDHIYFGFDDPEYSHKFADVFRDAVIRCGGTKGAGS